MLPETASGDPSSCVAKRVGFSRHQRHSPSGSIVVRTTAQRISSVAIVLGALTVGCLWSQAAHAQGATGTTSWIIGYSGSSYGGPITTWTAPRTGYYSVRAYGGSLGTVYSNNGYGAVIGGTFLLESGTTLSILVGGGNAGGKGDSAGGAGGTFVVTSSTTPLVVAGGGGGKGQPNYNDWNSINASLTTAGNDAYYGGANQQGSGGTNGSGGTIGSDSSELGSAGGGGFYGNGETHLINALIDHGDIAAQGGFSYVNGGFGGYDNVSNDRTASSQVGYFGGGGQSGGDSPTFNPGGGGGGYSGGGGGGWSNNPNGIGTVAGSGGGGGSYLDASALDVVKYVNNSSMPNFVNDGMVSISEITSARLTSGTTAQATVAIGTGGISDESLYVSNPGTLLTSSSNVVVGGSTTGNSMVISGGGRVENAVSGVIGSNAGASSNSVTVSGSGSNWTSSGSLVVGSSGTGNSLVVSSGGMVQTGSTPTSTVLGYNAGSSNNSVVVTGSGSTLTSSGVIVGYSGTGNSLVITNGGSMQSSDYDAVIGYNPIATGNSVQVTGSGSLWQTAYGIQVGGSGAGTLTVANGGNVTATQTTIAEFAGSSGALNIGGFSQSDAAGTISTPTIAFGAGSGRINFNQSNSTTLSSVISGTGAVYQLGSGTTILTGNNTYNGATNVDAGTLLINGNQSAANGVVTVAAGAAIGGAGSIGGTVTVNGILSPGNSPGVLTTASLILGGSSTSLFEINGLTRGTQYDGVNINAESGLTYGGALSLSFGNSSAFANNTTFDLFNFTGTPSNDFTSVTSTGFYAGTWTLASGIWSLESGGQTLSFTPGTGDLVVAVPEPSTCAMALAGLAYGGYSMFRRRKRA